MECGQSVAHRLASCGVRRAARRRGGGAAGRSPRTRAGPSGAADGINIVVGGTRWRPGADEPAAGAGARSCGGL